MRTENAIRADLDTYQKERERLAAIVSKMQADYHNAKYSSDQKIEAQKELFAVADKIKELHSELETVNA